MKHLILNKNDMIMVADIDIWTIARKEFNIAMDIEEKPSISGCKDG